MSEPGDQSTQFGAASLAGSSAAMQPPANNITNEAANSLVTKTLPITFKRIRSKPTSTKKLGTRKKVRKSNVVDPEVSNQDEWAVIDEQLNLDDSYVPNIPCRHGCGEFFETLQSADQHVRSFHVAPRVDQLTSLRQQSLPRNQTTTGGFPAVSFQQANTVNSPLIVQFL